MPPRSERGRGLGVEVPELRDAIRDLRRIEPRVAREAQREIAQALAPIVAAARADAPVGTRPKGRGRRRLRDTIRAQVGSGGVWVGSRLPYANIVHWGGRRPADAHNRTNWIDVKGRPFIARAAERQADRLLGEIDRAIDRVYTRHGFR